MRIKKAIVLACDFCGRDQDEVNLLVRGPRDVCICDDCVAVCVKVLSGEPDPAPVAESKAGA